MKNDRLYNMSFSKLYPMYVDKAIKKGRLQNEVDEIICWLLGYSKEELRMQIEKEVDVKTFFNDCPCLNPNSDKINGVVCKVKVQEIEDPLMRKIRYLDKLIDELAKGKEMNKIFR
ncbi:MAG: DUF2200 domain-containing protein [Pleomorphochaeta sp.]